MKKLILILCSLVIAHTGIMANQISWSSGSKTISSSDCSGGDCGNDTLVTTGSFNVSGTALVINSGCDGLTCVFTGHTIGFTSYGIDIMSDEVEIYGGTFEYNGSTSADSRIGIKMQGHDVLLKDVSCDIGGDNARTIKGRGEWNVYNVEIDGGTYSSACTGYTNRCNFDAAVMFFDDLRDETDAGFLYHVYIHDVTITDGPHVGIAILGRTAPGPEYNQGIAWIDNNTIQTDAQNDFYSSYSGTCLSSTNPYGVFFRHVGVGSRIYGNTITSGTDHGGSRGIIVERGKGTVADPILVRKNTVNVHEGPNVEFGDGLPVHGLRLRYFNEYVLADSNTFTVAADSDAGTAHTGPKAQAMRISPDKDYTNITLRNNMVTATANDASVEEAAAMVLDYAKYTDAIYMYNNNLTSSAVIYQFGNWNDQVNNGNLFVEGDTIQFGGIDAGYKTFQLGWLCNDWVTHGNVIQDVSYQGGTSLDDVTFTCGGTGTYDIKITRTLDLYAKGGNGLPVVGATITAENAYGATVYSETTNYYGKASGTVTYYYESNTWSDSAAFNDFTLTASYGSDQDVNTFTVGYTAAGGTDTLLLANTDGTGEWGEPPSPTNDPPSLVNGVTAVSTTPVNRTGVNTTEISATFFDVDDPGIAAFAVRFRLRYPNNITYITPVDSQYNGAGGLTIVEDSTGWYTTTYTYDPASDQTLGAYDLYTYVTDGTGYDVDNYSNNTDELTIGGDVTLTQTLTVIDTNNTSLSIEDNFSYQSSLDSVWLLFGTAATPTVHLDSIGTVTDPDTFSVTSLIPNTIYYYRTIATDASSTDTSSIGTITTLNTVAHSFTHIDSGGGYAAGEGYFSVENDYMANTVTSMTLVWGTSTSIASATGDSTILSGDITDPDTLGCDTLSANIYYYWWIIVDQLGTDTSAMQAIVVPLGGLRFGHWSLDSADANSYAIEDKKRLTYFTFDGASSSTLDTIYARLTNTTSAKWAQAALFGADSVLIDTSDQVSINTTGAGWWAFPMANADTLTNGTSYGLSVWGEDGDGQMEHHITEYSGFTYFLEAELYNPANWTPWTSTDTFTNYCPLIFGVYSAAAPTVEVQLIIDGDVIFKGDVIIE